LAWLGKNTGGWLKLILLTPITASQTHRMGRFRENITMRVEAGKKLVAYMGDDRRGATPGNLSAPVPSVHTSQQGKQCFI